MAANKWAHKATGTTLNWQYLSALDPDAGKTWSIVWDTKRTPGKAGRNTAVERSENAALERARHFLRMGFVVYEILQPSGSVLLDEDGIKQRIDLQAAVT